MHGTLDDSDEPGREAVEFLDVTGRIVRSTPSDALAMSERSDE